MALTRRGESERVSSGRTNLVEALRWAIGETSHKSRDAAHPDFRSGVWQQELVDSVNNILNDRLVRL
jgi:hypothetical protein